jgi:hypothetical protein
VAFRDWLSEHPSVTGRDLAEAGCVAPHAIRRAERPAWTEAADGPGDTSWVQSGVMGPALS